MTDAVLGGIGLGLVWGWWLIMAASPVQAHIWRSAVVLGLASMVLALGVYLLMGVPALFALAVASGFGATAALVLRVALIRRRADT